MTAQPCWEISERFPKFCASLANGTGRCRKGECGALDPPDEDQADELEAGA